MKKVSEKTRVLQELKERTMGIAVSSKKFKFLRQSVSALRKEGHNIVLRNGRYVIISNKNKTDAPAKRTLKTSDVVKGGVMGKILAHLEEFGVITMLDAIKLYNCTSLPTCIYMLRKKGYNIVVDKNVRHRELNTTTDRVQSCSQYRLVPKKKTITTYLVRNTVNNLNAFPSIYTPLQDTEYETFEIAEYNALKSIDECSSKICGLFNLFDKNAYTRLEKTNYSIRLCVVRTEKRLFKTKTTKDLLLEYVIEEVTKEV